MLWRTKKDGAKGQMTFISNLLVVEEEDAYFKDSGLTAEFYLHIASYRVPQTVYQTILIDVPTQERVVYHTKDMLYIIGDSQCTLIG